jgi:hypothetical protein
VRHDGDLVASKVVSCLDLTEMQDVAAEVARRIAVAIVDGEGGVAADIIGAIKARRDESA